MQNLIDILSQSNKDIDNQKLMDYVSGKLSAEDKHEVEKWMIDNEFAGEAWEGLHQFSKKKELGIYVDELNKELARYILEKKKRRDIRKIQQPSWIYFAIGLILLMIIVAYLVISKLNK